MKAGALRNFNNIFGIITFFGLSGHVKSSRSLKSAFIFGLTTRPPRHFPTVHFYWTSMYRLSRLQNSFWNVDFLQKVGDLLWYVCPPINPLKTRLIFSISNITCLDQIRKSNFYNDNAWKIKVNTEKIQTCKKSTPHNQ